MGSGAIAFVVAALWFGSTVVKVDLQAIDPRSGHIKTSNLGSMNIRFWLAAKCPLTTDCGSEPTRATGQNLSPDEVTF